MKKDTEIWLKYAEENIRSAEIFLESGIYTQGSELPGAGRAIPAKIVELSIK